MKKVFSIIVPVFNEQDNLIPLTKQIKNVFAQKLSKYRYEIILIDDGSTGNSAKIIKELTKNDPNIRGLFFSKNFGQTAAWTAGFDNAKGEILITMDADLQNDPNDIPKMYELMQKNKADIVNGWRKNRQDKFLRSFLSKMANKIINWLMKSNIKDSGCSLRLIKKNAIADIKFYGEMHRLLPFLLAGYGLKSVQTPVRHHPRTRGVSKYGFSRTFKVILDVFVIKFLTSYQTKPIYLFGIPDLLKLF